MPVKNTNTFIAPILGLSLYTVIMVANRTHIPNLLDISLIVLQKLPMNSFEGIVSEYFMIKPSSIPKLKDNATCKIFCCIVTEVDDSFLILYNVSFISNIQGPPIYGIIQPALYKNIVLRTLFFYYSNSFPFFSNSIVSKLHIFLIPKK